MKFETYCAGCGRKIEQSLAPSGWLSYHTKCKPKKSEEDEECNHMNDNRVKSELRGFTFRAGQASRSPLRLIKS